MVDVLLVDGIDGQFNRNIIHALQGYFRIASNEKPSRLRASSSIPAGYSEDVDILWDEHKSLLGEYNQKYVKTSWNEIERPEFSLLDLKIKIADKIFGKCVLCESKCMKNRKFESGLCDVKKPYISSEFLHKGEEPPLIPSHTIFFSGCNFKCVYCQNWDISQHPDQGMLLEPKKLARIIDLRRRQGSMNVNFVGGDPTPNMPYILRTMKYSKENIPIVWNSNLYLSKQGMNLLDGFVDLYLTDFKYGNNACAMDLSGIPNYCQIIKRNHKKAYKSAEMIIRHLILPNHIECCSKPLLNWIADNLGLDVVLNIMPQYRPTYNAFKHQDVSTLPTIDEINEVKSFAEGLGFINLI